MALEGIADILGGRTGGIKDAWRRSAVRLSQDATVVERSRSVNELEGVGPSARHVWEYLEEASSTEPFAVKEAVLCGMPLGPVKFRVQRLAKRWGLEVRRECDRGCPFTGR